MMRVRELGFQLWAAMAITWVAGAGVFAGSAYLEAQMNDAVRLEEHAKDLRLAGIDPATVDWTAPVRVGQFLVPPAQLETPHFLADQGGFFVRLAGLPPLILLLAIQGFASLCAALAGRKQQRFVAKRIETQTPLARPLVFPGRAGSLDECNMAPVPVLARRSSR